MRKVRREIREEYLYIHDVLQCVLQMLNLVIGDCLKGEATAQLEVGLGRVSSLFRCSRVEGRVKEMGNLPTCYGVIDCRCHQCGP